ncbi:hypothetical protein OV079_52285 [Nannocystis pusilla]|uniref:Uncharacterized protein n=1 Tax=Nannocystis pusilla TaxID=889268 RepID=A0A9X3F0X5_9BACT|nr:hypothetical protein [Nannocystis pusilla]MCY1013969.1 hypothetical protein [Nannocystis pusilla]
MKVDSQGRPHVFFDAEDYSAAVLDGGTWTTHTLAVPGSAPQFVLGPDDDEIAVAVSEQQLQALVGDQTVELGSSLPVGTFYYQAASAAGLDRRRRAAARRRARGRVVARSRGSCDPGHPGPRRRLPQCRGRRPRRRVSGSVP